MARVYVIYHSEGGHTRQMAEWVAQGACEAGAEAVLQPAGK